MILSIFFFACNQSLLQSSRRAWTSNKRDICRIHLEYIFLSLYRLQEKAYLFHTTFVVWKKYHVSRSALDAWTFTKDFGGNYKRVSTGKPESRLQATTSFRTIKKSMYNLFLIREKVIYDITKRERYFSQFSSIFFILTSLNLNRADRWTSEERNR